MGDDSRGTLYSLPIRSTLYSLTYIKSFRHKDLFCSIPLSIPEKKEMEEAAAHPYVPRDLKLPGYVPISMSMSSILAVYLGASLFVVTFVWFLLGKIPNSQFLCIV